jgi:hypothetical protein
MLLEEPLAESIFNENPGSSDELQLDSPCPSDSLPGEAMPSLEQIIEESESEIEPVIYPPAISVDVRPNS